MTVSYTLTAAPAGLSMGSGAYTTASQSIGTATSDRIVVFMVSGNVTSGFFTSINITPAGGSSTSMTIAVSDAGGGVPELAMAYIPLGSGVSTATTATFTIFSSFTGNGTFAVGTLTGCGSNTTPTSFTTWPRSGTTTPNVSLVIPTGGVMVAAFDQDTTVSGSWTNATGSAGDSLDNTVNPGLGTAHSNTGAGSSVTMTWTGTNATYSMVAAAWQPAPTGIVINPMLGRIGV